MTSIRMPGPGPIVAILAACLAAAPAAAQEFPDFGGVETRLGVASAQDGGTGFAATLELDLGFLNNPVLRGVAGFDYFGADLDANQGSFDAAGAMAGIRWDLLIGRTQPYLVGMVTAHNVNASATDPVAEDLLEGFYAGVGLGAGVMYGLGDDGRFNLIGDIRRVFANNIGRWNFAVGMRYLLGGPMAYAREGEEGRMAGQAREPQPQEQPVAGEQERDVERERQQVVAMEDESGLYQQLTNLEGEVSLLSDVRQLDGGVLVELRDRMFESGSASLTMSAQNELSRVARLLMDYEIRSVSIDAFTSGDEAEVGVEAQGQQLAQRRAEAIRTALVREGFDPLRITATGQVERGGMAEPGAEMESDRVEIMLRGIGASSR